MAKRYLTGDIVSKLRSSASVLRRLMALCYDWLIVIGLWLVGGLISVALTKGEAAPWLVQIIILSLSSGYFAWSWRFGGQTAGMRAWRLRVIRTDGGDLTWVDVAVKMATSLSFFAPLGLMLVTAWLFPQHQTIYDRLSKTQIIFEPRLLP
jgi:uncharacterized RDD family membrane protein YckC